MVDENLRVQRLESHKRVMARLAQDEARLYPEDLLFMAANGWADGMNEPGVATRSEDEQFKMCLAAQDVIRAMTAWTECHHDALAKGLNGLSRSGGTHPIPRAEAKPSNG